MCRLEVGRTVQVELKLEVGGLTEAVTVTSRGAAGRHRHPGDRRPHQLAGVRGHAVVQPQLRRLPRHAARRRRDDLGDDLRRRLDQRRRPERPQRQLHDGRLEQQRHLQRRQRRRAGARAGRGGAGVPAAQQPVRRRVRADLRRHRQLGVEAGHQPAARRCVHVLPGRENVVARVLRAQGRARGSALAAAAVGRRARRPDRARQGALLRQPRARRARLIGHHQHPDPAGPEPHRCRDLARLEHLPARRSPDQPGQHLGPALAARDLAAAAADPGDQPHALASRSRDRSRLDGGR